MAPARIIRLMIMCGTFILLVPSFQGCSKGAIETTTVDFTHQGLGGGGRVVASR